MDLNTNKFSVAVYLKQSSMQLIYESYYTFKAAETGILYRKIKLYSITHARSKILTVQICLNRLQLS